MPHAEPFAEPYTEVATTIPYSLIWDGLGKGGGWLAVELEGQQLQVTFRRVWHSGNNVEMTNDRLGRVSSTQVWIRFPYPTAGNDHPQLRSEAHRVINRLLDVYRVRTKEVHIGPIPLHELGQTQITHGNIVDLGDGTSGEECSVQFDSGLGVRLARRAATSGNAIQDLAYERALPVVDLLVLNARRSALFEDYRIAVIEAETAFEVGVDRVMTLHYLSEMKKSPEGHLVEAYTREDVERILGAGLNNLLRDHLPKAVGKPFIGSDEHSRWENDSYKLRNAVVHDGKTVQPEEAQSALAASEDALVWMGAIDPEEWPADDRLNQPAE